MRAAFAALFTTALAATAITAVTTPATAQRLLAYDPFGGFVSELQPPDAVLFAPNPPIAVYPSAPLLPPPPIGVPAPGDSTFDNAGGVHWFTDGVVLAAMPTPTFPPLIPVPPPMPIPPAVIGAIGGPVTGIAIDPATGTMFLVSVPGIVIGVAPVPGMPVVVPPFPIPFPTPPIAGLEWDGVTGSLWAVGVGGLAFPFFPGGAPAGAVVAPPIALPGPAGDIAIDKMLKVNPAGLRPLYVSAGGMVFDIHDPAPFPFPGGGLDEGLAFVNHPAQFAPLGGCNACPTLPGGPTNFAIGPMTAGNAAFAVGMAGMLPGTPCVFAFDVVFSPAFPMFNVVGCPLGLTISPSLLLFLSVTDGGGAAAFPIPLGAVPIGSTLYNQGFTFCAADPTGFVFSPLRSITVGGL